jgi:hypothetical protein
MVKEILDGIRADIPFLEINELRQDIVDAVKREREYQLMTWCKEHDKEKVRADWISDIVCYVGRAAYYKTPDSEYVRSLVKVMALCLASIETLEE